jgi:membrane associated rhomboid family serine protease
MPARRSAALESVAPWPPSGTVRWVDGRRVFDAAPRSWGWVLLALAPALWLAVSAWWWRAGSPTAELVGPSTWWAPQRWAMSSVLHVAAGHWALNALVWVGALWSLSSRVSPARVAVLAVCAQVAGVAAQLAVSGAQGPAFAGASPAVFAVALFAVLVWWSPQHTVGARCAVAAVVVSVTADQVAAAAEQLSAASSAQVSSVSHLAGMATAVVAGVWWRRGRRLEPPRVQPD